MKKITLLAAIAVFSFSSLSAQDISFGVKAGLNVSTLAGDFGVSDFDDEGQDAESKVGFHIGGVAELKLTEKFAIQPELLFSNQGFRTTFTDLNGDRNEFTVNLNYINLPIMAKFFPIENLAIEAGPQFGFLVNISDEAIDEANDDLLPGESELEAKDFYKAFDFGLNVGASYKLDNGIFFGLRYNFGLTEVDEDGDVEGDLGIFSRKNRVFQASAGFMF